MIDRLELARTLPVNKTAEKQALLEKVLALLRSSDVVDPGMNLQHRIMQQCSRRNFSDEARRSLAANGWIVYEPFDTSINWLEEEKKPFQCVIMGDTPWVKNISSRPSQVAILPRELYVPASNNISIDEQRKLMQEDEEVKIRNRMGILGASEIIGDVATHAALAFSYFEQTGIWLHASSSFVRTDSHTRCYENYIVGGVKDNKLALLSRDRREPFDDVFVMRLLVPSD